MSNKFLTLGSISMGILLILSLIKTPAIQVSYIGGSFYLEEDTFEIGWIHSVELEPWFETYQMQDDELYLIETKFKTFGAGSPYDGEVVKFNDGFIHMKLDIMTKELNLAVSSNVKTTLYTKKSTIPLYELVTDYETVSIEVKKLPLWRLLWSDFK